MEQPKKTCCAAANARLNNGINCSVAQDKCSLAMAYVPWQPFEEMYSEEMALSNGTAFPSLNMPFYGRGPICD